MISSDFGHIGASIKSLTIHKELQNYDSVPKTFKII